MPKTIILNDNLETSIRSVRVRNDDSIFSIKVNKSWLFTWIRRLAIIAIFIGYVLITYMSYTINEAHFWTLVKVGIILSLLVGFAFSKS